MATGRNRNRARARNRFRARGSRKKHWLSGAGTGIAAGALMGLMGGIIFFTSGLYAFQQGGRRCGDRLHGADGRIPGGYGHRGLVDGKGSWSGWRNRKENVRMLQEERHWD